MTLKNVLSQVVVPNLSVLKESLSRALSSAQHEDVGTRAYMILSRSGMDEFLDEVNDTARLEAKKLLTQHLVNGDGEATKKFLSDLVDAVVEELDTKKNEMK